MSSKSNIERKNKNKPEKQKPQNARAPERTPTEKPFNENAKTEKSLSDENFGTEVVNISEEFPDKYSKKIIQSNWQKYEAPIDTYEEREQTENMGADFEALLNTPMSSGGHFQFKHEKTWDSPVKSTQYDKHFEINMADLAVNLSSIPFYERNNLTMDLFSESDIVSMKARSEKFKHQAKRKDDHSFSESSDSFINKLKDALTKNANISSTDIEDQNNSVQDSKNTDLYDLSEIIEKSEEPNSARDSPPNKADPVQDEDLEEWLDEFLISSKR